MRRGRIAAHVATRATTRLCLTALAALACLYAARVATDLRLVAPTPTPIVLDRDGAFVTQAGHWTGRRVQYGYWVTPPPPRVVAATLALEDRWFWSHPGVDPLAVARAVWLHVSGRGGSGASTLAMQVARMQHPRPRTLWAKAIEAGVAVGLTARYGRRAVLAQYLRLAPYGEGSHGIGHAARWYFGRPAADLTWRQAALLAAVPQSPARLDPRRGAGAAARAAGALAWLAREGTITRADVDAGAPGLVPRPVRPPALQAVLRLGRMARALPPQDEPLLHATLDLGMQAWVTDMARERLRAWRRRGAQQAAVMVVRRGSRAVLAAVGSVPGSAPGSAPDAPGGWIDFTAARRSPGSTLKPFLYAEALDAGLLLPRQVMDDAPQGAAGIHNADHAYLGPLLPRQALANSRNVPAATLLRRVGLEAAFDTWRDLGLHHLAGPADRFGLAMALGALPTRLDRLVGAYATLAEDGEAQDLLWLQGQPRDSPRRLFRAGSARLVGRFLSDPMARLPSFPRYGSSEYPFPVALKTGTSQGYRDAWTVAWSSRDLVGVWVGRPDGGAMAGLGGGRTAATLAQAILLRLHGAARTDLVAGAFAAPAGWHQAELCTRTGAEHAPCAERLTEWVRPRATLEAPAAAPGLDADGLAIIQPDPGTHVWRNPESPPGLDRLVLRARAAPWVHQVVWLVDGQPVQTAPPGQPLQWVLQPGVHRFQLRMPLQDGISRTVKVVVE